MKYILLLEKRLDLILSQYSSAVRSHLQKKFNWDLEFLANGSERKRRRRRRRRRRRKRRREEGEEEVEGGGGGGEDK